MPAVQQLSGADLPRGFGDSGLPRSTSCVHVSQIRDSIGAELGIDPYNRRDRDPESEPSQQALCFFEAGFCWERALELGFRDRLGFRAGEVERDGITGSPDGIGRDPLNNAAPCLEEYKLSFKRAHDPADNWGWMVQTQAYCAMLSLNVCVFYVLWMRGVPKGPPLPAFQAFRVEFTALELKDNWSMLTNHAKGKGWIE